MKLALFCYFSVQYCKANYSLKKLYCIKYYKKKGHLTSLQIYATLWGIFILMYMTMLMYLVLVE